MHSNQQGNPMRQEVLVHWRDAVDFHLHADTAPPMEPDEARTWLDAQFTALECEPLRALGKVLTADKVLRITEAAGPQRLGDAQWAADFARAVQGAIGKPMVRIDVPAMTLAY